MKTISSNHQTYYKFKVTRKEDNETKLFFQYKQLQAYCGIPRSTLYKIFKGSTPTVWVSRYEFEQVRLPRHSLRDIDYS